MAGLEGERLGSTVSISCMISAVVASVACSRVTSRTFVAAISCSSHFRSPQSRFFFLAGGDVLAVEEPVAEGVVA